jgi:hypothetical protein
MLTCKILPSAGCPLNLFTAASACAGSLNVMRTMTFSEALGDAVSDETIVPHRLKMAYQKSNPNLNHKQNTEQRKQDHEPRHQQQSYPSQVL